MHYNRIIKKAAVCLSAAAITLAAFMNGSVTASAADSSDASVSSVPTAASGEVSGSVEYTDYTFAQINTRIRVPKSMITFTNSVTSADPNLSRIGASADQLRIMFDKNNLYLETMPENLSYEVILGGVKKDGLKNYSDMSSDELDEAFKEYENHCRQAEYDTVYSVSRYNGPSGIYFVADFCTTTDETTVYSRKYYTIAEGCEISIALQTKLPSAGDPNDTTTYVFDEAAAGVARDIVDNVSYSQMKEHFTDTSMFSELFGYVLGIVVTIGVLALILWLLIKTTSKPKKKF